MSSCSQSPFGSGGVILRTEHGKPYPNILHQFELTLSHLLILVDEPKNVTEDGANFFRTYLNNMEKELVKPQAGNYSAYIDPAAAVGG